MLRVAMFEVAETKTALKCRRTGACPPDKPIHLDPAEPNDTIYDLSYVNRTDADDFRVFRGK